MTDPERGGAHEPVLPEYGRRSLAEVTPSLFAALGVPGLVNPLGIRPARKVCLLLVDGLGAEQLAAHPADAPFLAGVAARDGAASLTAGFPSSTPVSLASLGTGVPPGAHGILGVSFAARPGELLETLSWSTHRGDERVDQREELPPERVQPVDTTLRRAEAAGVTVRVASAPMFEGSGLTRAALRGGEYRGVRALGDLAAELITALREPGPVFCYGYHADLDKLGHEYGPGSLAWRLELAMVDRLVTLVAEALPPDGLLVVTSDHGMVRVDESARFDADTDEILRAGVRLVGGDPRARHVYAEPGAADDVLATWRERLGEHAWVVSGGQAIAEGWFGPAVSPQMRARIGDVVAALRGSAAVIRSRGEKLISRAPGQHGSLTTAEQTIPLLQIRG